MKPALIVSNISSILFVGVLLVVGAYIFQAANEAAPSFDAKRELETTEVKPGGVLVLHNAFTREKRCDGFFRRRIIAEDGELLFNESEYRIADPASEGQPIKATRSFKIPTDAPLGSAVYSVIIQWSCNPVQRVWPHFQELPDLAFEIVQ